MGLWLAGGTNARQPRPQGIHRRLPAAQDLADRVSAYDEHAQALAWRATSILYAMNSATRAGSAGPISRGMLDAVLQFEGVLCEICAAMEREAQLKFGPLRRVLRLQRRESRLVRFSPSWTPPPRRSRLGTPLAPRWRWGKSGWRWGRSKRTLRSWPPPRPRRPWRFNSSNPLSASATKCASSRLSFHLASPQYLMGTTAAGDNLLAGTGWAENVPNDTTILSFFSLNLIPVIHAVFASA
ncbi:hypothetical protein B0H12DRAFT_1068290 [Mycena haematopus]|nr:hypothetical protein B0H12DRAFT_1068290 [Mycena haematopus]